jgi:hypothetical protein
MVIAHMLWEEFKSTTTDLDEPKTVRTYTAQPER